MQAPMGQSAPTLNSLLMYEEETNGDAEGLMDTHLLQARKDLTNAVRAGTDCSVPLQKLLQMKCHVSLKYAYLNVNQLLKDNNESVDQLKTIPVALSMLEKYGRHLLKPPGARVDQWRQIKFNNAIFKDRVLPMQGAVEVVQQMGYSNPADCGLQFAYEEPDSALTSNMVADIVLARTEMERYLSGKHPHPHLIHALIPESTVDQVQIQWNMLLGAETGTVSINPATPAQVVRSSTPVPTPVEVEAKTSDASQPGELLQTKDAEAVSFSQQSEDSMHKACDICGETAATVWCNSCDNKQLCDACDNMWHRHPKRHNHTREPICSLPTPSSAPGTDAIMGPFGIRAVHSLSNHLRELEHSPTPVSGGSQSAGFQRDTSRTPPPFQCQPTSPLQPQQSWGTSQQQEQQQQQQFVQPQHQQSGHSAQINLEQHQQQYQMYLQQSRHQQLLQQQQQQQQGYNNLAGPSSQYPYMSTSVPQDGLQASLVSGGVPGRTMQMMTGSGSEGLGPTSAFPPFPALDPPDASSALHCGVNSTEAMHQQRAVQFPQADVSLRMQQQPADIGDTTYLSSSNTPSYGDLSLRHSNKSNSFKLLGNALPVSESSVYSTAPGKKSVTVSSGGSASVSESSLLKAVLAEDDYEKRAAKCDIRLLTLQEDLDELEEKLKYLMLNSADFTECPDFMTLTRRKAVLMKEQVALSNYKQELASLMAAEPSPMPHRQSAESTSLSTQIYHPPSMMPSSSASPHQFRPNPSTSPGSSSPYPAVVSSATPPQLGFSYPHQASLSPSHTQELVTVSTSSHEYKGSSFGNPLPNSCVDTSSILPQWQMTSNYPAATFSSASHVSQQNQASLYSTPIYFKGDMSNNHSQPSFVTPVVTSQPHFNVPGQTGGRPLAQEHAMTVPSSSTFLSNISSQGFAEPGPQDLNQAVSAPRSQVSRQPGNNGAIGFENFIEEQQNDTFSHHQPELSSRLQQQLPAQKPVSRPSSATLTPSPPPDRPTTLSRPTDQGSPKFDVPKQKWQCNHCTFINEAGSRVCIMCDRTSNNPILMDSPTKLDLPSAVEFPETNVVVSQPNVGKQLDAALPTQMKGMEKELSNVNSEQLTKFQNKIAEELDQVYREKQQAHEEYSRKRQEMEENQSRVSPPSMPPPPLPARIESPLPRPPVPPRRPSSQASGVVSPQSQVIDSQTEKVSGKNLAGLTQSEVSEGSGNDCSGCGDSIGLKSSSSSNVSSTCAEKLEPKIQQMQRDGEELMHFVKVADRMGAQIEEMHAALKAKEKYQEALDWLRTEWSKLVQVVVSSTRTEGQKSDQNDIGDLSAEEARKALRESKGDLVPAVKSCSARRKQLYTRLNPNGEFAREDVLQAMLQSCGDEEVARDYLYSNMLQPFVDRMWAEHDGESRTTVNSTLLQMAMAESVSFTSITEHPSFQNTILDASVDRDRRVRMVLVEGRLKSWGRADLVIKLLDVDLPKVYNVRPPDEECPYTLDDVVEAVKNCGDRQSALVYLKQDCSICFETYPMNKIRNLNFCQCKICSSCLKRYFEVAIRQQHVRQWSCPACNQPDLNDTDTCSEYLSFLGMLLQRMMEKEVCELFETKVRDWRLHKMPNFRWCANCGNGFLADERQLRMECPQCKDKTCFGCTKKWEDQHEGLSCEEFARWKIENDPNNQAAGLARHLEENGIDCPQCHMRYDLAKGGCMHFKCRECGHEFCCGCFQRFYQKHEKCPVTNCMMGLHAHHPRNCYSYLRDCDVDWLQELLRGANVAFNTMPPDSQEDPSHCPVSEQKESHSSKVDESCGKDASECHAGLCVSHYKEYLAKLVNRNGVDPAFRMELQQLQTLLQRAQIACPKISNKESEANYHKRIVKYVREKIPLPKRGL